MNSLLNVLNKHYGNNVENVNGGGLHTIFHSDDLSRTRMEARQMLLAQLSISLDDQRPGSSFSIVHVSRSPWIFVLICFIKYY